MTLITQAELSRFGCNVVTDSYSFITEFLETLDSFCSFLSFSVLCTVLLENKWHVWGWMFFFTLRFPYHVNLRPLFFLCLLRDPVGSLKSSFGWSFASSLSLSCLFLYLCNASFLLHRDCLSQLKHFETVLAKQGAILQEHALPQPAIYTLHIDSQSYVPAKVWCFSKIPTDNRVDHVILHRL